jgi:replication factor A1
MAQQLIKVADIKSGMRNITVMGKVIEIGQPKEVRTRYGPARVAAAVLQDDTGTIRLNLWRDQIEKVKVGDPVRIENAFVREFSGRPELNIGADGRIIVLRV